MYKSEYKGITFIEGDIEGSQHIETVRIELNGMFSQNQLKTLDDVKDRLVDKARSTNGNAIVDFKYGQRSTFLKSIFGMDDVYWYASGIIARIPNYE